MANLREQVDVPDTTSVACGCGRTMTLDGLRGPGAYRCGCGIRVKIALAPSPQPCAWRGCHTKPIRGSEPVVLCEEHTAEWRTRWFPEESRMERYNRLGLICDCSPPDPDWVRGYEQEQAEKAARSIVYYIRAGKLVKIGVTTDLRGRLSSFNVPGLVVLATERGDVRLERQRHREFRADRVRGEWFQLSDRLQAHIASLRAEAMEITGSAQADSDGQRR